MRAVVVCLLGKLAIAGVTTTNCPDEAGSSNEDIASEVMDMKTSLLQHGKVASTSGNHASSRQPWAKDLENGLWGNQYDAGCYYMHEGRNCVSRGPRDDRDSNAPVVRTVYECAKRCAEDPHCNAFTYQRRTSSYAAGKCWKRSLQQFQKVEDCMTSTSKDTYEKVCCPMQKCTRT
eukprot:TRINITY_DN12813_c0_g5_i1.p1 TRINITY_DN12813_c0_g5~~TRINITY_DN12813_c0_g5_i1.p1  ORF type:complete len:176 (-),score=14.34 TRINITY_DN12813_c0_g5_i1:166-693(-)